MKKNLIFLTLLISVLMVSVVSAGITGYLVRGGDFLPQTSTQIQSVDARTSSIVVDGKKVQAGETFEASDKTYEVVSVEKPGLFSRSKANIIEVPQEASGIAGSGGSVSCANVNTAMTLSTLDTSRINSCEGRLDIGSSTTEDITTYSSRITDVAQIVGFEVSDMLQIKASNYGSISPNPSDSVLFQILSGISPLSSGMYIYTQQVQFTRFAGSGTAYACLGPDGSLFRSATPCV